MSVDGIDLDPRWWKPHFDAGDKARLIGLEYLGSEARMALIHQRFRASVVDAPDTAFTAPPGPISLDRFDELTRQTWLDHLVAAERDVRAQHNVDRRPHVVTELTLGTPRSTWQPTPYTRACWRANNASPFPVGYLVDLKAHQRPTKARLVKNVAREQTTGRLEGFSHHNALALNLDDGYPYDPQVLSVIGAQVANDLLLAEPGVALVSMNLHILLWAARLYREGVRPCLT